MPKPEKLKRILKGMRSVLLAFSGGADSSFLLKVARDTLGNDLLAVTAVSATYPRQELAAAKRIGRSLKVKHRIIRTAELNNRKFTANPENRCYFCKKELFARLKKIASANGLRYVIDASNATDKKDFRPGNKAKKEFGVRSPLQEAGFSKSDIRKWSKKFGLPTWDKPSLACLASRIPYGRQISPAILAKIEKAEETLKGIGFKQIRLRHYGRLCRIEIDADKIRMAADKRNLIVAKLKRLGYNYITLDLAGYRTGSLNEVLK